MISWLKFYVCPDNSKIAYPRKKSVIIKNGINKISDDFCLNVVHVKHHEGEENAREVARTT